MEFVRVGAYVNLAHVAYVQADDDRETCMVHFAVPGDLAELGEPAPGHLHLYLEGADARRLLDELDRVSGPHHAGP